MTIPRSAGEVLARHVIFSLECIDRLYLNLYVPDLQTPRAVAHFWLHHRGFRFASSALMSRMTASFVQSIERFAKKHDIDVVTFKKGQRKEDVAHEYLARFSDEEGVLFIGKAQEKNRVVRTERRYNEKTGAPYAQLVDGTAIVNQYYFYVFDKDFGLLFVKLGSYFPYNGRVCLNGHEYLKQQLAKKGIPHAADDNAVMACDDPKRAQRICDRLTEDKIEAVIRKWLRRLPHPFPRDDREAGYCHEISILQAEFSITQVFDRPLAGRVFFEEIIRENIDLGRPNQVQLIFNRRVQKNTPGRFRTRVITDGVIPSLHVDYKNTRIKQYYKHGRALRTETIVNNTYDFEIGKRLKNLPELRKIGFQANQRLLGVQRISHDPTIGEDAFQQLIGPVEVGDQRVAAMRFGDVRVLALLSSLLLFYLLPRGFRNRDLRDHVAVLLGKQPGDVKPGQMTYDLRRLRLHGLIEKIPRSHRYKVTDRGMRTALFLTRAYNRLLRPGFAVLSDEVPPVEVPLRKALDQVGAAVESAWDNQRIRA